MSKQRSSASTRPALSGARGAIPSRQWMRRVFRNSYTRGGRCLKVKGWSVKFQHQGTRRTFSLAARTRAAAAIEAQAIFQTLVTEGWDAAMRIHLRPSKGASRLNQRPADQHWSRTDVHYWKQRVVVRKHASPLRPQPPGEYSVRIDHAGMGHYFPLGTGNKDSAAARAHEIFLSLVRDGWATVNRRFPRELTVGLHWTENPLAWTYATFPTVVANDSPHATPRYRHKKAAVSVLLVEPDESVRSALAGWVNRQEKFACVAACANATDALREVPRIAARLALVNRTLPDSSCDQFGDRLRRLAPGLPVLFFATYEDSDQLFRATPGGATGYLLKRTAPGRLFEPIAALPENEPLSHERIALQVRRYFQDLIQSLTAENTLQDMARLTHREQEILNLLSKGYVDKEIADALGISAWTVHGHLKKIFEKLDVHTRTEAAIKYLHK